MKGIRCLLGLALLVSATEALAGIKVYVDKNHNGASIQIDSAIPDLRKLDFDDRISSLQADETWLVCSAPRYKGDCREVEGSLVNLREEGLNDRITSLRPAKQKGKSKKDEAASEKKEKAQKQPAPAVVPAVARPMEWWGGAS
jgi:hypothetical protein